jgi:hypothetical protein
MALTGAPFPSRVPPILPGSGLFHPRWVTWLRDLRQEVDANPSRVETVSLENQSASISTTPIPTGALVAGLYQVLVFTRITTPGTASSSLRVDVTATDDAISYTQLGTAITGNTTATTGRDIFFLSVDGASPVSYSTTYATSGATAMVYKLELALMLIAGS